MPVHPAEVLGRWGGGGHQAWVTAKPVGSCGWGVFLWNRKTKARRNYLHTTHDRGWLVCVCAFVTYKCNILHKWHTSIPKYFSFQHHWRRQACCTGGSSELTPLNFEVMEAALGQAWDSNIMGHAELGSVHSGKCYYWTLLSLYLGHKHRSGKAMSVKGKHREIGGKPQ